MDLNEIINEFFGVGCEPSGPAEEVDEPEWYAGEVEPIDIIERVVEGLPPDKAYSLGQVLRYCLRAGKKDDVDVELGKANNYAHRLVYGHWRSK